MLLTFSWFDPSWSLYPGKNQHLTADRTSLSEAPDVSSVIFRSECRGHTANGGTDRKGNGTARSMPVIQAVRLLQTFWLLEDCGGAPET